MGDKSAADHSGQACCLSPRLLFLGGGTGGHLVPGVAVAEAARGLCPAARLLFLVPGREVDRSFLGASGWEWVSLGLGRGRLRSLAGWLRGLLAAVGAVRRFGPGVLVGLGGYGSLPGAFAGLAAGARLLLLDMNALPGRANRFLARRADLVCGPWAETARGLPGRPRFLATGTPVRASLARGRPPRPPAAQRRLVVLVLGGSQGARAINEGVAAALPGLDPSRAEFIHLTGPGREEETRRAYQSAGFAARVLGFTPDPAELFAQADLAVSRAGGSTLAELAVAGLPALAVPFPHAVEEHQLRNARAAARAGGVVVCRGAAALAGALRALLADPERLASLARAQRRAGRPGAAREVARQALLLAGWAPADGLAAAGAGGGGEAG